MADEPETEDETLELTEELEEQTEAEESQEGEEQSEEQPEGDEEETLVSFGDADPDEEQPDDSTTMRDIRRRNRELNARIRELETSAAKPAAQPRPKPTLESCDYDEEKYDAAKAKWDAEQAEARAHQERIEAENREIQTQWQQDLENFAQKKAAIKFTDAEEADAIVRDAFRPEQWATMLKAANDPALFTVAISKAPEKLAELAKMKDVIKLGAAIARMEGGIKVVTKRKAPNLDVPQRGSAKIPGADEADKQLARLEKEAEASGDRTKLIQYRKQMAAKGK